MKPITWIARLLVGTLFILSGLVKANDSHGFGYKLEEYFEVFIHDLTHSRTTQPTEEALAIQDQPCAHKVLPSMTETIYTPIPEAEWGFFTRSLVGLFKWLSTFPTGLALLICVIEVLLGLATLFGFWMRPVTWLLLGMILFFTFLTFYSAYFNKVTDCGCFGDALPLTPWQSFWKDIFLLVFILPLWWFNRSIRGNSWSGAFEPSLWIGSLLLMAALVFIQFKWNLPFWFVAFAVIWRGVAGRMFKKQAAWLAVLIPTAFSFGFGAYCTAYEPVRDYRPWKVGNYIPDLMQGTADQVVTELVYFEKGSCNEVRKNPDVDGWEWYTAEFDENHLFAKQDQRVVKKGVEAKVKDLVLVDPETDESMTSTIMEYETVYLVVFHRFEKADMSRIPELYALQEDAVKMGIHLVGAAAVGPDEIRAFKAANNLFFPIYFNDEKPLKTIVRSNPGMVRLSRGTVTHKYSNLNFPKSFMP